MSFKKIPTQLEENLNSHQIIEPNAFQLKVLPKIKSGTNLFAIGPKDCGKTTALVISVISKLKAQAIDDNPRALIFVKDRKEAELLEAEFTKYTRFTNLRVYAAFEEHTLNLQKDKIYLGVDVVIATPKRLSKLYFLNGINLTQLQMFIVEDAEFLIRNNFHTTITRISESLKKCQHIIYASKFDSKISKLDHLFMENAQKIEF